MVHLQKGIADERQPIAQEAIHYRSGERSHYFDSTAGCLKCGSILPPAAALNARLSAIVATRRWYGLGFGLPACDAMLSSRFVTLRQYNRVQAQNIPLSLVGK